MASVNAPVLTFQGGIIGGELHNRVDIPTYPQGCEISENWRPKIQGPMSRRPPMLHVAAFTDHAKIGKLYKFGYSAADSFLVQHTSDGFAFFLDDVRVTVPNVTASLSGWTDASTAPSTAAVAGGNLKLTANGAAKSIGRKTITSSNVGTLHVVKFEVVHGPVNVRIGTAVLTDNLMEWTRLRAGVHWLSFTPDNATTYLEFWHDDNAQRRVKDNVALISGSTTFLLPTPYIESAIPNIDRKQIRDVLYLVHNDYWPRRLERRGTYSWSIVKLLPDDGPFGDPNATKITLAGSATVGFITLTASEALFSANDVDVLYELSAGGQNRTDVAAAGGVFGGSIKVTGVGATARTFTLDISGTFVATVTLQRSSGNENDYTDWQTYTVPTVLAVNDAQDNQTWFYRLAVKAGNYTSGSVTMKLTYQGGSTVGVVRVIEYTSTTAVFAEVIEDRNLAAITATDIWKRGAWNGDDGFPSNITRGYARLFLAMDSTLWASKSDDFTSFDEGLDADQAFTFAIASESSEAVRFLAMVNHLVIGTSSQEFIGLANTTAEPIGPANFQLADGSEEGSAAIRPVVAGNSVLYVHKSLNKLMQFVQNPKALSESSYISVDLTARAPEILDARIAGMAVQREPDRRIFVYLQSGRLLELLFRREAEIDVVAWGHVVTAGRIEDAEVLSSNGRDEVYFITRRRNASNAWVRAIEKYGPERLIAPDEYGHLDGAVRLQLEKPDTVATPSGTTGTITVETDADAFVSGDAGSRLWINFGRGTIASYVDATHVTVTVTTELASADPADNGAWGFGPPTTIITGLAHLEGLTVSAWGDHADLGTYTVASSQITLSSAVSMAIIGRNMRSRWKSLKLSYGAQKGTALTMPKAIKRLGLLLYRCGATLKFGPSFAASKMWTAKTRAQEPMGEPTALFSGEKDVAFDGGFAPDARLCIEVDGAAPATVSGYVLGLDERDR